MIMICEYNSLCVYCLYIIRNSGYDICLFFQDKNYEDSTTFPKQLLSMVQK